MIRRLCSYLEETFDNQLEKNRKLREKYYEVKNNRNKKFSQILDKKFSHILDDILVIAFGLTVGLVGLFVLWIEDLYIRGYLLVFGRGDPE